MSNYARNEVILAQFRLTSASASYYPAARAEIINFTPQKLSTMSLPTPSSKPWTLKRFLCLSSLIFLKLLKAWTIISSSPRTQDLVLFHWYIAGSQVTYLTDPNNMRIGTLTSSTLPLTHGITQGSISSALLFTIYTNDLPPTPKICKLESYVDDPKVFFFYPQGHPATFFCKISVRRSKYCLEISKA